MSFGKYHKEEWVENCCEGGLGIRKSPSQRKGKKNRIKDQWVIKQKAATYRKCAIKIL